MIALLKPFTTKNPIEKLVKGRKKSTLHIGVGILPDPIRSDPTRPDRFQVRVRSGRDWNLIGLKFTNSIGLWSVRVKPDPIRILNRVPKKKPKLTLHTAHNTQSHKHNTNHRFIHSTNTQTQGCCCAQNTSTNRTQWPTTNRQRSPHLKKRPHVCSLLLGVAASSLVRDYCCLLRTWSISDLLLRECASSRLLLHICGHWFASKCQVPLPQSEFCCSKTRSAFCCCSKTRSAFCCSKVRPELHSTVPRPELNPIFWPDPNTYRVGL